MSNTVSFGEILHDFVHFWKLRQATQILFFGVF